MADHASLSNSPSKGRIHAISLIDPLQAFDLSDIRKKNEYMEHLQKHSLTSFFMVLSNPNQELFRNLLQYTNLIKDLCPEIKLLVDISTSN